jgi:hypothetical protein
MKPEALCRKSNEAISAPLLVRQLFHHMQHNLLEAAKPALQHDCGILHSSRKEVYRIDYSR